MALQTSNKLRVYAENGNGESPVTVLTDTNFNSNAERQSGSKPNTVIDSKLMNTVLKETSTVCAALIDALKQISGDTTDVGIETTVDALATLMKAMLTSSGIRNGIVTAGNGISIDSNGVITTKLDTDLIFDDTKITHANAITAGAVGPTTSATGWNKVMPVPRITYDANGHITGVDSWNFSTPQLPKTTYNGSGNDSTLRTVWSGTKTTTGSVTLDSSVSYDYCSLVLVFEDTQDTNPHICCYVPMVQWNLNVGITASTVANTKRARFTFTSTTTLRIDELTNLKLIKVYQTKEKVVA